MGKRILIVGGVAGGASAAARLRRLDESAEIIMLERGEHISFANCGLPYYIGGDIAEKASLTLQTPESFNARFDVDVRVLSEAVAIDRKAKRLEIRDLRSGETYSEPYDKLILSPGAEPIKPNISGLDSPKVFTLRNIPDAAAIRDYIQAKAPKSAAVVGGGYIGMEMAENLAMAGLDVTVIELMDHVIAPLDFDMAADVHNYVQDKGVHLVLGNGVKAIRDDGNALSIELTDGEISADMLILSVGVRPESSIAKSAGLDVNERGCIVVGPDMLSCDSDIYAVGDAVQITDFVTGEKGFVPLAGPANKQGRIAADNIAGRNSVYAKTQGSAILKLFDMTIATTGINETTAKRLGLDYEKSFTYSASHASYYPGAKSMSVKTLFQRGSGKILGVQIVGFEGVDKRCDVFATAIRAGMCARDLTELELCYAPPFSSAKDPVNMAGYVICNILDGDTKHFHWHDVSALARDGSVTLLDVRTPGEFRRGAIEGFVNIPLDELRKRSCELDPTKPVYLTCQVGLRGHFAARLLTQKGFDVYNLCGGYRLYKSICRDGFPIRPPSPSQAL